MINYLFLIMVYIGLAKLFWNIILIFLPFQFHGVALKRDFEFDRRVAFSEKFMSGVQLQSSHSPSFNNRELQQIRLKVIFRKGSRSFILIEDKGKKHYINLKEDYKGYQLVKIKNNFVVFERDKKFYKIRVKKEGKK